MLELKIFDLFKSKKEIFWIHTDISFDGCLSHCLDRNLALATVSNLSSVLGLKSYMIHFI